MLTQFYAPIIGGIERYVQSLSAALVKRGHHVAVVTLLHPGLPEEEMDGEVCVYRIRGTVQRIGSLFSTDRFHAPPFPDPEAMISLRSIIEKERPDLVHAHNWMVHSFLPLKGWSRAKLVMTLHDSEMRCVQMRMMYMDRVLCSGPGPVKCLRCAVHHYGTVKGTVTLVGNGVMNGFERSGVDQFIPVSSAVAASNDLINNDRTKEKVQVIPNFIPDDIFRNSPIGEAGKNLFPEEPFILQVGDLVPDKGIYVLLEAYQGLRSAPPLVLIGRRTPDTPCELPSGVRIIECLPHDQVMDAWQRCLFGVVASLNLDASPTVTLEAMACGRPVIGSRIGGIVDQVSDGQTGLLVPPGDVQGLAAAMQSLIDDPERCARMGLAAKNRVTDFQASSVVDRIEKVYRSL
jgi:glycosyltransferase involved in cell wall biosynthesis